MNCSIFGSPAHFHGVPTLRVTGFISGGLYTQVPVAFFRSKNTALGTTLLPTSSQWNCKSKKRMRSGGAVTHRYSSCTPRARKCWSIKS